MTNRHKASPFSPQANPNPQNDPQALVNPVFRLESDKNRPPPPRPRKKVPPPRPPPMAAPKDREAPQRRFDLADAGSRDLVEGFVDVRATRHNMFSKMVLTSPDVLSLVLGSAALEDPLSFLRQYYRLKWLK